jgi:hypothetical protein
MNDDGGVLGRLPRSRPGTRSEKRAEAGESPDQQAARSRPAASTARAAKSAEQRKAKASRPAKAAAKGRAGQGAGARSGAGRAPRPSHSVPPEPRPRDPIAGAVRTGVKVAEGGIKLAGGITRELLRRLPRP